MKVEELKMMGCFDSEVIIIGGGVIGVGIVCDCVWCGL